jgi:hypothetical protein
MNESQANFPSATEAAPASPSVGTNKTATSAPDTQFSPPASSDAVEMFTRIKHTIKARTNLSDADVAISAFWVISTWFQEALIVLPCLVITGPAHGATELLRVLHDLCCAPVLLAGFRRGDLKDVSCRTLLIAETNMTSRTAALLGSLTNRGFIIVEQGSYLHCHSSKAIYIGDDPPIKRIQNAIYIDVTPALYAAKGIPQECVYGNIEYLRGNLAKYRENNLAQVRRLEFIPTGVSPETGAIAKALGSCIVDSPDLRAVLVSSLAPRDQQQISERLDSAEALVVEAVLVLSREGAEQLYAREIAVEVNRLMEARGERSKFSPEKVGHRLRKLGLPTRRLSQAGNGLVMDNATLTRLMTLCAMYVGEDQLAVAENLRFWQTIENNAD